MNAKRFLPVVLALCALAGASAQQQPSTVDVLDSALRTLNELRLRLLGPTTVVVPNGGDLSAAIAAATPGTIIELEPGQIPFAGTFRGKPGLTVRTRGLVLPDRAPTEAECAQMARVVSSVNNIAAFHVPPSTHDVRLERIAFEGPSNDVILVGAADATQTSLEQAPRRTVIDQTCVKAIGIGAKNGIAIHSAETTVTRNYIRDVARNGIESHGIVSWNGPGPFVITGNHVLGSHIGIFFGGAAPAIVGTIPSDILVRGNLLQKHADWSPTNHHNYAPKNALECKACRRLLVDGNIIDRMPAGGQAGWAIVFTPSQMDGPGLPPWAIVEDVTFIKNIVRGVGGVFNLLGHGQNQTLVGRATLVSRNLTIRDNWLSCDSALGGHGALTQIGNGPIDLVIEHNTVECNGAAFLRLSDAIPIPGFRYTGNLQIVAGTYGVFASDGSRGARFEAHFPGGVLQGNALVAAHPTLRTNLPLNTYVAPCTWGAGTPCVIPQGLVVDGYGTGALESYGRRRPQ